MLVREMAVSDNPKSDGDLLRLQDLGSDRLPLVRIALAHCLMPHPKIVASFRGAVFPSIRDQRRRLTLSEEHGNSILRDDNVTPRWALLWSHGISATHHLQGWTFAHVWAAPKDPAAYTHLANICMMPEYFGSLSDKDGPLCAFLKFHSWDAYGWRPCDSNEPRKPEGYDSLEWRYLPPTDNPRNFVRQRMAALGNQRVMLLRPLMERWALSNH